MPTSWIVQNWLREQGLVAVDRSVAEQLAAAERGGTLELLGVALAYKPDSDTYHKRR
jgi:hypothetical protein